MVLTVLGKQSDSAYPTLAPIIYSMVLNQPPPASESLAEDESFLTLEIRALESLSAICNRRMEPSITAEHLLYLEALHSRGEYVSGLDLINRLMQTGAASTPAVPDLLICKADMLLALEREAEAEAALAKAGSLAAPPKTRQRVAIKMAELLIVQTRIGDAESVLEATLESLEPAERTAEIVTALAALRVQSGQPDLADKLLMDHIHPLDKTGSQFFPPLESAICRVFLGSLLVDRGRCDEADELLSPIMKSASAVTGPLKVFAHYFMAVSVAARMGILLPEALTTTRCQEATGSPADNGVLTPFAWLITSREKIAGGSNLASPMHAVHPYVDDLFHYEEIERQGRAYELLSGDDFSGAIDIFCDLARIRTDAKRHNGLLAAVDSNALALGLKRACRSGAVTQARATRRHLQILLGLSSAGTQKAVLDEAQLLMDQGHSDEASAIVEPCLLHPVSTDRGREISLRLRLILRDVATRSGQIAESAFPARSLELEARSLGIENEVIPVLRYESASAAAAREDFDVAEHEFESLRRDLEAAYGDRHELSVKATYGLARVLQRRGEYEQAVSLLLTLLNADTTIDRKLTIRFRKRIIECLLELDDPAGAEQQYRACADALAKWTDTRDPAYLDARLGQADCLLAGGRYRDARVIYRGVWELLHGGHEGRETFYMRAIIGNGTTLRRMHEYSGAAFNYDRASRLNSIVKCLNPAESTQLEKWLAWSLEMAGELSQAADHYRTCIQLLQEVAPDSDELSELKARLACCSR